jgi:hypothetical protein
MGFNYLPIFDPSLPLPELKDNEEYRVDAFYRDDFTDSVLYMFAFLDVKTMPEIQEYFEDSWGADAEIFNVSPVLSARVNNDGNF